MATSPVSNSVLMAQAIRSGRVTLPARPTAPDVTVLGNVKASGNGASMVNEDPIAADPSNANHLETAGNDYNCSSLQGVFNSDDGGATWRHQCVPVVGAGGCGDPNVAYDTTGKAYFLGIGNCNGSTGSIVFESSTNNGVSWSAMKTAFGSLLGGLVDKPWTEIDTNSASPFKDCLYTSWTDFNSSFTQTRASVAHSCDGGNTWTRVPVDSTQTVPKIDQFTDLAIGPSGTVYLTWQYCKVSGATGDCGGTAVDMKFSKSTDGGNTWSVPVVIATVNNTPDTCGGYYGCFPGSSERLANIPSVDYDNGSSKLWVAFYNYTGGVAHAQLASSTNDGATWSAPATINPSGNAGWIWCSVNDSGRVAVSFLFSQSTGTYQAAAVLTMNGTTFPIKKLISNAGLELFSNDGFGGGFIGDYTGGIWTGNTWHMSWMDTRSGGTSQDYTGGLST